MSNGRVEAEGNLAVLESDDKMLPKGRRTHRWSYFRRTNMDGILDMNVAAEWRRRIWAKSCGFGHGTKEATR